MTTNIYILKLENNKYYIGKSNNVEKRYNEHINGTASTWTKKYKPLLIEKIISSASPFDEDKYTIEYMGIYGIDNVRGGIYVTEALDGLQRYTIKKSIWGANDCCTQCGRKGHFVKNCKALTDVNGEDIYEETTLVWQCSYCDNQYDDESECYNHEKYCKRKSVKTKYHEKLIKADIYNCRYCNKEFKTQKGAIYHENIYCDKKNLDEDTNDDSYDSSTDNSNDEMFNCKYCNKEFKTRKGATFHENVHCKSKENNCYRCGRKGHISNDCYAKTDIDGNKI
jgi:predicted GIY-YIG superfamily endonuclease